jgi:hypothetical protein
MMIQIEDSHKNTLAESIYISADHAIIRSYNTGSEIMPSSGVTMQDGNIC